MDMIGHYHITDYHESIALTNLFENSQKQVAVARACEPGLAMVTTASQKVEIVVPVVALQTLRHALNCRREMCRCRGKIQVKIASRSQLGMPTLCKKRKGWATRRSAALSKGRSSQEAGVFLWK